MPGVLRSLLDGCAPTQNYYISERHLLSAGLRAIEVRLNPLQSLQHILQVNRIVDGPILLWREAEASSVRATALVGTAERSSGRPSGRNQLGNGQS